MRTFPFWSNVSIQDRPDHRQEPELERQIWRDEEQEHHQAFQGRFDERQRWLDVVLEAG